MKENIICFANIIPMNHTTETTGAGDTFGGCCLYHVLENSLHNLNKDSLTKMLTFANAAASIITTRKGALRVMPSREEIEELISCEHIISNV